MDIRMIAMDLDRTLLRPDKTVSAYTAGVLRECRARGVKVVFATARPERAVVPYLDDVAVDALILHCGAVVYAEGKKIAYHGIPSALKDTILQAMQRDNPAGRLSVEINERIYTNFDLSPIWAGIEYTLSDFHDLPDLPAEKIIFTVREYETERINRYLTDELYIEVSEGELGLIMDRNATKWAAVLKLAAYFNISTEQIAAFGDDLNDIGIIKNCGIGIAVKDALEDVLAAADELCDTCENDGVAKWLNERVL
jgi:hypothetical protein